MKTRNRMAMLVSAGALLLASAYWFSHRATAVMAPPSEPHTALAPAGQIAIVRSPSASRFWQRRAALPALPAYEPGSTRGWQVDVRGRDLRTFDLTARLADLRHADFDSRTRWPANLPATFDPAAILELNKNPGLGLRALHAHGVTGRGVGIGIIDQTLLVNHVEYRDRLRSYEEIAAYGEEAQMHGPAVASIAVGRTVGVAPEADLYYIAITNGTYAGRVFTYDFHPLARAIDRLLDINRRLPAERRMRVISVSVGWSPRQKGYAEAMAAVERAMQANVFVLSCSVTRTHALAFHGLGRDQMSDPDRAESYRPGLWWEPDFRAGMRFDPGTKLLVPMDARAVASPTGPNDYVYYANGGWSWSVPWIAGLYALGCQVRPDLTPAEFWAAALRTGRTIPLAHGEERIAFGSIADPTALLDELLARTHAASGP